MVFFIPSREKLEKSSRQFVGRNKCNISSTRSNKRVRFKYSNHPYLILFLVDGRLACFAWKTAVRDLTGKLQQCQLDITDVVHQSSVPEASLLENPCPFVDTFTVETTCQTALRFGMENITNDDDWNSYENNLICQEEMPRLSFVVLNIAVFWFLKSLGKAWWKHFNCKLLTYTGSCDTEGRIYAIKLQKSIVQGAVYLSMIQIGVHILLIFTLFILWYILFTDLCVDNV